MGVIQVESQAQPSQSSIPDGYQCVSENLSLPQRLVNVLALRSYVEPKFLRLLLHVTH